MKIAVIGASNNKDKFGFIIVKNLSDKGYNVFPVNPTEKIIYGLQCYKEIKDLPEIDIINFVTPPKITLKILQDIEPNKNVTIWCQPGSNDQKVINYLKDKNFKYISDKCIMYNIQELH